MNEMYQALIESFKVNNFKVSKETMKVIQDALNDFEYTEISYYSEDDLVDFNTKLKLKNTINMDLTGDNSGTSQWSRTYLGAVDAGVEEVVELKEQGIIKHTILNNNYDTEFNGEEDAVVVVESILWDSSNSDSEDEIYNNSIQLYIYVRQEQ